MSPRKKTPGDGRPAEAPVEPSGGAGESAATTGESPGADVPATSSGARDAGETAAGTAEQPKRRRRGTRGGRRHRKPAGKEPAGGDVAGAKSGAGAEVAAEVAVEKPAPEAPIESAAGENAPAARKKTSRRRGGRTAAAAATESARDSATGSADQPEVASEAQAGRKDRPPAPPSVAAGEPAGDASMSGAAAEDGRPAAKRRHRGSRGGRRRHKAQEAAAAEAAREAEEAVGELPAAAGPSSGAAGGAEVMAPPPVAAAAAAEPTGGGTAAEGAAAAEETGKPTRRRRLRGRKATPGAAPEQVEATGGEMTARDAQVREASGAPEPGETPPLVEAGSAAAEEPAAGLGDEGDEGAQPKRRRRGGRRGRGKRAAGASEEAEAVAETPAEAPPEVIEVAPPGEAAAAATPVRAKTTRRRDRRRPAAIVRQDEGSGLGTALSQEPPQRRPAVSVDRPDRKTILVTDDGEELRVALVEDGRLAEIYIERPERKSYLGDIYQGKVENVLAGIDAAFVDFGLEKNGFLYVDEVTTPEGEKRARRIGDALKNGQQVLVQVTKDPMGSKGARLSTKISLAGRYLVYVPGGSGVGVSRRLKQSERDRLRDVSKQLKPRNAGLIVRTIAEGHGLEDLRRDMQYLSRLWSRLKKKAETVKAPGLVHKEVDISLEVTRDLFNDTCESLVVDDAKRHKAIVAFLDKEAPELLPKVHQHTGEEPLFEAYGIEDQISRALERRVPLPSGGNLVIDHAEALTVIDVNTGRFTRGKGLEDTITKTNLEAAREVVRQLRLRDIGGIIIIDFIDMAHAKNREMVLATLEAELETDRTKTYVVELSPLGLVEMTRQNTTDGARGILTRSCPACAGKARVLSEETVALSVERRVRALARRSQAKAWLLEVNAGVADRFSKDRLKRLEKLTGRRVFLEGGSSLPVDTFRVLAEGSVAHVQEQRVPVREGQEAEVELEFSLTYSPRDAVGYIDGYMVIVEGGRQALGQRRKVRVTSTARTGATATLVKQAAN